MIDSGTIPESVEKFHELVIIPARNEYERTGNLTKFQNILRVMPLDFTWNYYDFLQDRNITIKFGLEAEAAQPMVSLSEEGKDEKYFPLLAGMTFVPAGLGEVCEFNEEEIRWKISQFNEQGYAITRVIGSNVEKEVWHDSEGEYIGEDVIMVVPPSPDPNIVKEKIYYRHNLKITEYIDGNIVYSHQERGVWVPDYKTDANGVRIEEYINQRFEWEGNILYFRDTSHNLITGEEQHRSVEVKRIGDVSVGWIAKGPTLISPGEELYTQLGRRGVPTILRERIIFSREIDIPGYDGTMRVNIYSVLGTPQKNIGFGGDEGMYIKGKGMVKGVIEYWDNPRIEDGSLKYDYHYLGDSDLHGYLTPQEQEKDTFERESELASLETKEEPPTTPPTTVAALTEKTPSQGLSLLWLNIIAVLGFAFAFIFSPRNKKLKLIESNKSLPGKIKNTLRRNVKHPFLSTLLVISFFIPFFISSCNFSKLETSEQETPTEIVIPQEEEKIEWVISEEQESVESTAQKFRNPYSDMDSIDFGRDRNEMIEVYYDGTLEDDWPVYAVDPEGQKGVTMSVEVMGKDGTVKRYEDIPNVIRIYDIREMWNEDKTEIIGRFVKVTDPRKPAIAVTYRYTPEGSKLTKEVTTITKDGESITKLWHFVDNILSYATSEDLPGKRAYVLVGIDISPEGDIPIYEWVDNVTDRASEEFVLINGEEFFFMSKEDLANGIRWEEIYQQVGLSYMLIYEIKDEFDERPGRAGEYLGTVIVCYDKETGNRLFALDKTTGKIVRYYQEASKNGNTWVWEVKVLDDFWSKASNTFTGNATTIIKYNVYGEEVW